MQLMMHLRKCILEGRQLLVLEAKEAVKKLFDELVDQFVGRNGGYTRIYKLAIPRLGDAAEMGIIEFVEELQKKKAKKKRSSKKNKLVHQIPIKRILLKLKKSLYLMMNLNLYRKVQMRIKILKAVIKVLPIPTLNLKQNWNQL